MILRRHPPAPGAQVRAAGGVVWRDGAGGVEVVLVHRPKYDDWTMPKGKVEGDESDEACALREVEEETGLVCQLEDELSSTAYIDSKGRPKVVRWWAMAPVGGRLSAQHEVDEARWMTVAAARALLSYERDRGLLDRFVAARTEGAAPA